MAERKKKRKETKQICDKSHIFAQTTHDALTPPKLSYEVGSGHSQPCQVSSQSVQGFGFLRDQSLLFSHAWHYGLYNRLGLPSTAQPVILITGWAKRRGI